MTSMPNVVFGLSFKIELHNMKDEVSASSFIFVE